MYKIAIVDDEQRFIDDLNEKIVTVMSELKIEDYECSSFINTDQLFLELDRLDVQGLSFDLILLDISLNEEVDGMDLAYMLRKRYPDIEIAFVTTHNEYVFEGYEVRAIYYFVKPVRTDDLKRILKKHYGDVYIKQRILFEDINDNQVMLNFSDIIYAEHYYGTLTIFTKNCEFRCKRQIQQVIDDFEKNSDMINTHKSFWVNLNFIQKIKRYKVMLNNQTEIPISKMNYLAVKEQYESFLLKKL